MNNIFMKVETLKMKCLKKHEWLNVGDIVAYEKVWDKYVIFSNDESKSHIILDLKTVKDKFELVRVVN